MLEFGTNSGYSPVHAPTLLACTACMCSKINSLSDFASLVPRPLILKTWECSGDEAKILQLSHLMAS